MRGKNENCLFNVLKSQISFTNFQSLDQEIDRCLILVFTGQVHRMTSEALVFVSYSLLMFARSIFHCHDFQIWIPMQCSYFLLFIIELIPPKLAYRPSAIEYPQAHLTILTSSQKIAEQFMQPTTLNMVQSTLTL